MTILSWMVCFVSLLFVGLPRSFGLTKVIVPAVYKEWSHGVPLWATNNSRMMKDYGYSVFAYQKLNPNESNYLDFNRGTETAVYLKYIVDHYHDFPDIALFVHAHPISHNGNWFNLLEHLPFVSPNATWFNINGGGEDFWLTRGPTFWPNETLHVEQCWRNVLRTTWDLQNDTAEFHRRVPVNAPLLETNRCCNQFIMSRALVLKRPLHVWQNLLHLFAYQKTCHVGEPDYENLYYFREGKDKGVRIGPERERSQIHLRYAPVGFAGEHLNHVIFGHMPLMMNYSEHDKSCVRTFSQLKSRTTGYRPCLDESPRGKVRPVAVPPQVAATPHRSPPTPTHHSHAATGSVNRLRDRSERPPPHPHSHPGSNVLTANNARVNNPSTKLPPPSPPSASSSSLASTEGSANRLRGPLQQQPPLPLHAMSSPQGRASSDHTHPNNRVRVIHPSAKLPPPSSSSSSSLDSVAGSGSGLRGPLQQQPPPQVHAVSLLQGRTTSDHLQNLPTVKVPLPAAQPAATSLNTIDYAAFQRSYKTNKQHPPPIRPALASPVTAADRPNRHSHSHSQAAVVSRERHPPDPPDAVFRRAVPVRTANKPPRVPNTTPHTQYQQPMTHIQQTPRSTRNPHAPPPPPPPPPLLPPQAARLASRTAGGHRVAGTTITITAATTTAAAGYRTPRAGRVDNYQQGKPRSPPAVIRNASRN